MSSPLGFAGGHSPGEVHVLLPFALVAAGLLRPPVEPVHRRRRPFEERSEDRRVGKGRRSRGSPLLYKSEPRQHEVRRVPPLRRPPDLGLIAPAGRLCASLLAACHLLLGLPEVTPPARSTFSCPSPLSPPASFGRRLNRFIAAAVPSRSATVAASAAAGTTSSTTFSSPPPTLAAPNPADSHPSAARPTPNGPAPNPG